MAGLRAILTALARAVWRDLRSLNSLAGNNFFLFIVLLLRYQPSSALFFVMILGILLLGPLSADPLRKSPRIGWPCGRCPPLNGITLRFVKPTAESAGFDRASAFSLKVAKHRDRCTVLGRGARDPVCARAWNH